MNRKKIKNWILSAGFFGEIFFKAYYRLMGLVGMMLRLRYFGVSYLAWDVRLVGIRDISLGRNSSIGSGSLLNVNHRNCGMGISIGKNTTIGRDNFFSSGAGITVGEYCLTTKGCSFICSSHLYENPLIPYSMTGTSSTDSIYIGANCFFGYASQVIGNVRVGHGSIIGSGAVVRSDIPPFSVVVGNPARIIRRFDFQKLEWSTNLDSVNCEFHEEEYYLAAISGSSVVQPLPALCSYFYDLP